MSRRVLVTGASGFLGSYMLPLLVANGHEVHAVSTKPGPHIHADSVAWHVADMLAPEAPGRLLAEVNPEWLVHLAWYTEHGRYWNSLENLRWVEASLRIFTAFAAAGGVRAVCAGTCAEYAWTQALCTEGETPLEPATFYGIAKDATHRVVAGFAERASFELAWARPFLLYGPGEDERRLIPSVTRSLLEGNVADVSDGTLVRDFLHVEDVALAFVALIESEVQGPVNISSGVGVTLREVIERVAQAAGAPGLVRFGAVPRREGDPGELVGNPRRLHDEVLFTPGVSLDAGISATVEWWRARSHDGLVS